MFMAWGGRKPCPLMKRRNNVRVAITIYSLLLSVLLMSAIPLQAETITLQEAVFAGGCFWCMQPPFDHAKGVIKTEVGYTGGHTKNPNYRKVSHGTTGHLEAIRIRYNPAQISYQHLLDIYWQNINPTQADGQFVDRGSQYHTAIFFNNDEERQLAEQSKRTLQNSGKFFAPIAVKIRPLSIFYPAEDYHQSYYQKNPLRYQIYKKGSGRSSGEH
jgi:methionine-S-sulfoxide reductase